MYKKHRTEFEELLLDATEGPITEEEALFLFENSKEASNYLQLFKAASAVRQKEIGNMFQFDGWMGSNTECKIDPPCRYCRRAVPGRDLERWEVKIDHLPEIAQAFKETGTTTVEIGGGTNPEEAGPTVIEILKALRECGLNVWVNVGPALKEEHIQKMKELGVEAITSSFETTNEKVFKKMKPGDSLDERKKLAHMINDNGVGLFSVLMVGIGSSYRDYVDHLFYLKELENFRWLGVTWLRIFPGSPLEGEMTPPSPLEAARAVSIARLILRDVGIGMSGPQYIQLSIMAGANRMVHAGTSLHKKGGFHIGGQGFTSGTEHIDVADGYQISNLLPITARYAVDAGMEVEPSVAQAVGIKAAE